MFQETLGHVLSACLVPPDSIIYLMARSALLCGGGWGQYSGTAHSTGRCLRAGARVQAWLRFGTFREILGQPPPPKTKTQQTS